MKQYIDKSTLVAEIEKRLSLLEGGTGHPEVIKRVEGVIKGYKSILSFLDTIEVEVGLENLFQALPEKIADEKSHQIYELSIYHYDGQCFVDYVGEIDQDSLYTFNGNTLYEAIEKAWNWLHKNLTGG